MPESPRIDELRRRIESDPASIAFAALAEEYRRAGRYEAAIATCAAGLKRHPSYLSAHVTLGRALIELGRYEDAQEELEFVLRAAPENLAAIRGLAEIHHRRGDAVYSPEDEATALLSLTPAAAAVPDLTTSSAGSDRLQGDPAVDAQLHALERFLRAVEQARGATADHR